jgi:hypothetical protein
VLIGPLIETPTTTAMAAVQNASFASPLADAKYAQIVGNPQIDSILSKVSEISGWSVVLTVLAVLVAYDQCEYFSTIPNLSKLCSFLCS